MALRVSWSIGLGEPKKVLPSLLTKLSMPPLVRKPRVTLRAVGNV